MAKVHIMLADIGPVETSVIDGIPALSFDLSATGTVAEGLMAEAKKLQMDWAPLPVEADIPRVQKEKR